MNKYFIEDKEVDAPTYLRWFAEELRYIPGGWDGVREDLKDIANEIETKKLASLSLESVSMKKMEFKVNIETEDGFEALRALSYALDNLKGGHKVTLIQSTEYPVELSWGEEAAAEADKLEADEG